MAISKPSQEDRPKLKIAGRTPAEKERCRVKLAQLTKALTVAKTTYTEEAKTIVTTHGRSLTWTQHALHLGGRMLRKRRAAHAWNAFVSRELKAANSELAPGSRHQLTVFMRENHTELQLKYSKLSVDERKMLEAALSASRIEKEKGKRSSAKAIQKDVNASFDSMVMEWDAIAARTGVEGFYIAVRSDIGHYHEPKNYFSPKARIFFTDVLGLDVDRFTLQLEAYVVSGLDKELTKTSKHSVSQEISACRKIIQEGLDAILLHQGVTAKVMMNYANYERKIVEEWGVELQGWPEADKRVTNPGGLHSRPRVQGLLTVLESRTCCWIRLTESEVEERIEVNMARVAAGENIYKSRKKSAQKKLPRDAEVIDDAMEEVY